MENEEKQRQRLDKNEEIKETGTLNLNGNGHKANIQLLTIIGIKCSYLVAFVFPETQKPPNMSI